MTARPILITGANGQVGQALALQYGAQAVALSREEMDLAYPQNMPAIIDRHQPQAIINAAAYTAVDKAEEEAALAHTINAEAVRVLAEEAFKRGIPFVHYSTDYVFPGSGVAPWKESDDCAPVNVYGQSKRAGEEAIIGEAAKNAAAQYLIFRTSWVYDETGRNFVNTMLKLGREKEVISVVADQVGAPTYARDIASLTAHALRMAQNQTPFPSGIYHLTNGGEVSWHGFAEAIFAEASRMGAELTVREVRSMRAADYPTMATRPLNSRLDGKKFVGQFGKTPPHWSDALSRCLKQKYALELAAFNALQTDVAQS